MATTHKSAKDNAPFTVAILTVVLLSAFALRYYQKTRPEEMVQPQVPVLNEATCTAAGGAWNECASACRGAKEGEPCIMLCVQQCECFDDNACPFSYTCQAKIEGKGICAIPAK